MAEQLTLTDTAMATTAAKSADGTMELEGTIERFTFQNDDRSYSIAKLRVAGRKQVATIVGLIPGSVGESVRVTVKPETHKKYGEQFKVIRAVPSQPVTVDGVVAYLGSGMFPGIRLRTAKKIVAHLGQDTLKILAESPDRLAEVPGIPVAKQGEIIARLKEHRKDQEARAFLFGLGLPPGTVNKCIIAYGESAPGVIEKDPYRLINDVRGIGFAKADTIAMSLDADRHAPSRVEAAIIHALEKSEDNGHTFSPDERVIESALELLNGKKKRGQESSLPPGGAVGRDEAVPAVVRLLERGAIQQTPSGHGIALPGLIAKEGIIAARLKEIRNGRPRWASLDLDKIIDGLQKILGVEFAPEQRLAIAEALNKQVSVITGGPGTGKTTTIKGLIAAIKEVNPRTVFGLAAPTGRAAQRMSEATGMQAQTVHRLLGFGPQDDGRMGPFFNEMNTLPYDVLIIDEMSMTDVALFYMLLNAIGPATQIILVGDADQIPSVGPGAVLQDVIASEELPVTRLEFNYRQAAGSEIAANAHRIRKGEMPLLTKEGELVFLEAEEASKAADIAISLFLTAVKEGWDPRDVQILSPIRAGDAGTTALNKRIQSILRSKGGPKLSTGGNDFYANDKVIVLRNDPRRGLSNGDIGVVREVVMPPADSDDDPALVIDFAGTVARYAPDEMGSLTLAYAITVHKSQGSEFPLVIYPVLTQHYLMLQRNLLYTGVTRAKRTCYLVGQKKAIGIAVGNTKGNERHTLLRWFLTKDAGAEEPF